MKLDRHGRCYNAVKRISGSVVFVKRIFPMLWFGFVAFFVVTGSLAGNMDPLFVVVPVLMAAFGFFLMKNLVWDLVDEVYDCGDFLLVKQRGEEDTIPLSNIMNVSVSMYMNPPRIVLRLANPASSEIK